jgi:hypothetical protein
MAFPLAPVYFDYSERASRLRTAYPQRVSRGRRERQAQGDAGHVCAEAMEKVMPPRKNRSTKTIARAAQIICNRFAGRILFWLLQCTHADLFKVLY